MFGIGTTEVLIILAVALLVIGPSKLPEVAKALGKGMAEFKKMSSDMKRTIDMETHLAEMEEEEKKNQDRSATEGPADDPAAEFSTDPPSSSETDMAESKGLEETYTPAGAETEAEDRKQADSPGSDSEENAAPGDERQFAQQKSVSKESPEPEDQASHGEKQNA